MRWLKLTSPDMRGSEVSELQAGLNRFLARFGYPPIAVDGDYGPLTALEVKRAKSLYGFPSKAITTGASPLLQELLAEKRHARDPRWRARARYRWARIQAARRRAARKRGAGVDHALEFAWQAVHAGVSEHPPGSNDGPYLEQHFPRFGWTAGEPWCQYFVDYLLWAAGGPVVPSGYTPTVAFDYATRGQYGLHRVPIADRRPGDWLYYYFGGPDACDHVGLYIGENKTIEGNTSPGLEGSQNNGGVVALKDRDLSQVVACVRPRYSR